MRRVLAEKLGLAALAALAIPMGLLARSRDPGNFWRVEYDPLMAVAWSVYSGAFYVWKTLWPLDLGPIYVMPSRADLRDAVSSSRWRPSRASPSRRWLPGAAGPPSWRPGSRMRSSWPRSRAWCPSGACLVWSIAQLRRVHRLGDCGRRGGSPGVGGPGGWAAATPPDRADRRRHHRRAARVERA